MPDGTRAPSVTAETVPPDAPDEVKDLAARAAGPRVPCFDATVGVTLPPQSWTGAPREVAKLVREVSRETSNASH